LSDERAQAAALYRQYGPAVYRRCLRLLRDQEPARDATQEVFRKLLLDKTRMEGGDDVLPWIYRVATNHCLNLLRDRGRRGETALEDGFELAAQGDGPEALYPERQLARQVLARFDTETQAVAVGVLVDGMEHAELASALGISAKTVSRKLEKFLTNARKFLARSEP
jgi:RNA polymerase sigma-70 factor (ECF subfamily)